MIDKDWHLFWELNQVELGKEFANRQSFLCLIYKIEWGLKEDFLIEDVLRGVVEYRRRQEDRKVFVKGDVYLASKYGLR